MHGVRVIRKGVDKKNLHVEKNNKVKYQKYLMCDILSIQRVGAPFRSTS